MDLVPLFWQDCAAQMDERCASAPRAVPNPQCQGWVDWRSTFAVGATIHPDSPTVGYCKMASPAKPIQFYQMVPEFEVIDVRCMDLGQRVPKFRAPETREILITQCLAQVTRHLHAATERTASAREPIGIAGI
jgi:hypothetical protein